MASILDLSGGSSDSENDGDYVPPANVDSEESSEDEDSESETLLPLSKKAKLDEEKGDKKGDSALAVGKKTSEDVWKNFLKDVESTPYKKSTETHSVPEIIEDEAKEEKDSKVSCSSVTAEAEPKADPESVDKSVEAEPKADSEPVEKSVEASPEALGCDKMLKEVEKNDLNNHQISEKKSDRDKRVDLLINRGEKQVRGLSSVLGAIAGKDKKVSVLEKSKQDWMQFKESENIAEELQTFNKGKQGFIERQRFLQRSDLRLFETEKSARLNVKRK